LAVSAPANGRILAAEALSVHGDALARRPESFPDDVRARLLAARAVPLSRVAEARAVQSRLRRELRSTFADVHALVIPTVPCRIPPVGVDPIDVAGAAEPVVSAMTRLTNSWNLAGTPAGSVPAGRDDGGAPIGVQVVGPWGGEQIVLGVMEAIEGLVGGPWPPVARDAPVS